MEDGMKKLGIILFTGLILVCCTMQLTYAQTIRSEAANHPRIAAAIRELEGAIAYMERAPHDFGLAARSFSCSRHRWNDCRCTHSGHSKLHSTCLSALVTDRPMETWYYSSIA
jgi:hypothetical protein